MKSLTTQNFKFRKRILLKEKKIQNHQIKINNHNSSDKAISIEISNSISVQTKPEEPKFSIDVPTQVNNNP